MADGWNRDEDERGRGGSGSGSSSGSSGRESFGKTSDFSTTIISKDGKFFGFQLSPEMARNANLLYSTGLPKITETVEEFVGHQTKAKIGSIPIASLAGYGVALTEQIIQTGQNIVDSTTSLNNLRVAVAPLAKSSKHAAPLSGDNEVLSNARGKISSIFWQNMLETTASTISSIPAILGTYNRQQAKRTLVDFERKAIAAKDNPDEMANLLDMQLSGNLSPSAKKELTAKDIELGKRRLFEIKEDAYRARFNEFREKNKTAVTKEIKDAVLKLTPEHYFMQWRDLESLGIDVSRVKGKLETLEKNGGSKEEMQKAINEFKALATGIGAEGTTVTGSKAMFTRNIEDVLRVRFVKREGAWDETWLSSQQDRGFGYSNRNQERPLTLRQQLDQDLRKMEDDRRKLAEEKAAAAKVNGKNVDPHSMANAGWGLGAGIVREIATNALGASAKEKYAKPIALDRILHLRRTLEAPKDSLDWTPPDQVPPVSDEKGGDDRKRGGDDDRSMSYAQYINEIFQQHQRDSRMAAIGDRFTQHFEEARWNDDAIQKLSDAELTPYEFAIKTISKRIKDGRMDSIALVELVGDHHGKKIVHADGRSFGPSGAGKTDEEVKKAIEKLIDDKTAALHTGGEKTDEQINEKLGNFVFSVEDMKKALESDELDRHQRAFIFTLFSDVVGSDAKLCQKLGIKSERCDELRRESKETFNVMLDGAVAVLAETLENDPQQLEKKLKITDKERELVESLEQRAKKEGKHVADLTKDREEIAALETLAANAAMALRTESTPDEDGKPQTFWQRVVAATKSPKKGKADAEKDPLESMGYDGSERDVDERLASEKKHTHTERVSKKSKGRHERDPLEERGFDESESRGFDDDDGPGFARELAGTRGHSSSHSERVRKRGSAMDDEQPTPDF